MPHPQDALASVKAETLVAEQYKSRAESSPRKEGKKEEKPKQQTSAAAPDRKALNWQKRNEWFGGSSTKDRIKKIKLELTEPQVIQLSHAISEYQVGLDWYTEKKEINILDRITQKILDAY